MNYRQCENLYFSEGFDSSHVQIRDIFERGTNYVQQLIVCAKVKSQCLYYLGYMTLSLSKKADRQLFCAYIFFEKYSLRFSKLYVLQDLIRNKLLI